MNRSLSAASFHSCASTPAVAGVLLLATMLASGHTSGAPVAGPSTDKTPPPGTAPAEAGASSTVHYEVDPARSRAGFEMAATLHTVRGSTSAVSGEFTMPAFPAPAGFEVRGKIIIAAKELDTGNKVRDRKMRSDSLDVERYPEIVFAPSRAVGTGVSLAPGTTVKLTLQGELTIRGVTRPLAVSVTASVKEKAIVADGSAHLSFLDFGVPDPSSFFLHVNPNLQVLLHLEARATSLP